MLALIAVTADGWKGTRARRPMDDSRALACIACMSALHPTLHSLQLECPNGQWYLSSMPCCIKVQQCASLLMCVIRNAYDRSAWHDNAGCWPTYK